MEGYDFSITARSFLHTYRNGVRGKKLAPRKGVSRRSFLFCGFRNSAFGRGVGGYAMEVFRIWRARWVSLVGIIIS